MQVGLLLHSISELDQWLTIDFRHLAALEAVASHRSFSRAAIQLGYTQSAVSQQIATLERVVGVRLVERPGGPRPVSLTLAGELMRSHSGALVQRLAAARADMAALAAGETGRLRIGTYQSAGARILPATLRDFRAAWPKVETHLTEATDDRDLLALVERGELDITFVSYPLPDGPFASILLLRDPLMALVAADSDLAAAGQPVTLSEIAELPLIAYSARLTGDLLATRLRARGIEPRIVFRSDDHGTIHGLVAAGFGAALIPRLGVDPGRRDTRALELAARLPPRLIGLAWHRDRYRHPAAEAFTAAAQAVCAAIDSDEPVA